MASSWNAVEDTTVGLSYATPFFLCALALGCPKVLENRPARPTLYSISFSA
jgi:hypothetical protein